MSGGHRQCSDLSSAEASTHIISLEARKQEHMLHTDISQQRRI